MQNIALPKKIEFVPGEGPNQGSVVIEPCYPGYGITIGNSVRRVLLSSLPGAAVIGLKVKGADHEFMSLPHIKEDVLEIVLNIKQLRVKMHTDEVVRLELDVHGEKEVKAGDIKSDGQVEIINKDLAIAHITDMAGKLNMEIFVAPGRGYETIESREGKKNELGYIEIDSVYSPIMACGISVENVRVGKITNWDKLVLNITTDGSISVMEAFENSVKILMDQFGALLEVNEEEAEAAQETDDDQDAVSTEEDIEEPAMEEGDNAEKKKRGRPKKA